MKKSINHFIEHKISNLSKVIGGCNGLTTGADEQISTSVTATEID